MQKIKNIEFLRTFLILGIIMLHSCVSSAWSFSHIFKNVPLYQTLHDCFAHSNNGVEGFFIIAGFLLVITFKNTINFVDFVKKKYIRLSPPIAFATILCILGWLLHTMHFKVIPNILTVMLLNHFGICWAIGANPVLWFTSALFSGLLFYFCIIKYIPKKYHLTLISILSVVGYLILEILQKGRFSDPYHNYHFMFNVGFLRAIGGIGFGCIIGIIYKEHFEKIQKFIILKWQKVLITLLELIFLSFIVWWMICPHIRINNLVYVIFFTLLLALFILNTGYISQFFDKDIWVLLGKYQYSIYVVHYPVGKILGFGVWKHNADFIHANPLIPILVTVLLSIIVGVFTYHCVEEPCAKYLKDLWLNASKTLTEQEKRGGG